MQILTGEGRVVPLGWRHVHGVVFDAFGHARSACFFCDTFHPGVPGHFYGVTGWEVKVRACQRCAEVVDMDPVRVVRAALRGSLPRSRKGETHMIRTTEQERWLL